MTRHLPPRSALFPSQCENTQAMTPISWRGICAPRESIGIQVLRRRDGDRQFIPQKNLKRHLRSGPLNIEEGIVRKIQAHEQPLGAILGDEVVLRHILDQHTAARRHQVRAAREEAAVAVITTGAARVWATSPATVLVVAKGRNKLLGSMSESCSSAPLSGRASAEGGPPLLDFGSRVRPSSSPPHPQPRKRQPAGRLPPPWIGSSATPLVQPRRRGCHRCPRSAGASRQRPVRVSRRAFRPCSCKSGHFGVVLSSYGLDEEALRPVPAAAAPGAAGGDAIRGSGGGTSPPGLPAGPRTSRGNSS